MKAFPEITQIWKDSNSDSCSVASTHGMDLRDYFAAKALHGIVSTVPHLEAIVPIYAAVEAYEFADAMMKAREQ